MPRLSLCQRLRYAMVRPDDDANDKASQPDRTPEEVRESIGRADDKERAIGLIAAPSPPSCRSWSSARWSTTTQPSAPRAT